MAAAIAPIAGRRHRRRRRPRRPRSRAARGGRGGDDRPRRSDPTNATEEARAVEEGSECRVHGGDGTQNVDEVPGGV